MGARVNPQLPPMTEVTPCRRTGWRAVPVELGVVVGVGVDEPRGDHQAGGVEGPPGRLVDPAHRHDRPSRMPTSAEGAGAPVPSTTVPPVIR